MRMYASNPTDNPDFPHGYTSIDFKDLFPGKEVTVRGNTTQFDKIWLFNAYLFTDGTVSVDIQHNNTYGTSATEYLDDDGVRRSYAPPFSGCSAHTYTFFEEFLNTTSTQNKQVMAAYAYFYAPEFPQRKDGIDWATFIEDMITQTADEEYITTFLAEDGYTPVKREANCDWREIIFQMAKDFRKYAHYTPHEVPTTMTETEERDMYGHTNQELLDIAENFGTVIRENNKRNREGEWYYPTGKTGYEQYYTDLEGFWRQLYCPPCLLDEWYNTGVWTDRDTAGGWVKDNETKQWTDVGLNPKQISSNGHNTVSIVLDNATKTEINYFLSTSWKEHGDASKDGWNKQVVESPATINFWFDFLDADEDSDFAKYSVPVIGDRAKSVNDDMVKAIYFREIPNTIFTTDLAHTEHKAGYTYMQYQEAYTSLFTVSTQGKCAIDVMEEWINNYVYATESVNVTAVPVYHLQPNTRVHIYDPDSKINGDYIVSRISIPLTYNGTMSITATKVAERIYQRGRI